MRHPRLSPRRTCCGKVAGKNGFRTSPFRKSAFSIQMAISCATCVPPNAPASHEGWACYHTELYVFRNDGHDYGIVGCAVGAAFAVLIAEELFASGCRLLISITSAGQIAPLQAPPYFVVIDRALRDEGTSYHYLPASEYSEADVGLTELARAALSAAGMSVRVGASWTTDAPFRETEEAIAAALHAGILAVEMEAAALYAFAKARGRSVVCFAHVTNQMGRIDEDFEKRVVGRSRGIAPSHFPDGRSVARSERILNVFNRQSPDMATSAIGPSVWTGRALQAESDDLEKLVLRICIRPIHGAFELLAIMDIRARSISFASRPRRPEGPPDHERAGETFLHLLISTRRPWWEKPTQKLFWISALGRRLGDAGFITALLSQHRPGDPCQLVGESGGQTLGWRR